MRSLSPRHGKGNCRLAELRLTNVLLGFVITVVTRALDKIEYTLLPLPKHDPTELILVSPCPVSTTTATTVPPLLVQPHGGPHSQAVTEFSYSRAAAVLHGYRFVDVNYPGSTGFGQKTIDDLPPLLGTLEVEATLAAGRYLAELGLASRERNKNLLMGGSHGGWTACHLTARWPGEYGAVVMRNPVTDLVANASMTDIPDWCYEEAGIAYPLEGPPSLVSPEDYQRFYEISPMRHAHRVTTPTLLLIGLEDRRVPPNQGRAWYHALKKLKVDVKMMTFPGNSHPIAETVECVSSSTVSLVCSIGTDSKCFVYRAQGGMGCVGIWSPLVDQIHRFLELNDSFFALDSLIVGIEFRYRSIFCKIRRDDDCTVKNSERSTRPTDRTFFALQLRAKSNQLQSLTD